MKSVYRTISKTSLAFCTFPCMNHIQVIIRRDYGKRKLLNAILALITGVLALGWPNLVYYIAGGYLVALSLLLFYFRVSSFLTALAALSGLLIFLFPELIPYTFAFFLTFFGLTFIISLKLVIAGILMLIFALLIISDPGSVAYMIGLFLILYGGIHIINLLQESRRFRSPGI